MEDLWVLPDYIGKDIGRKLFEHAIKQAQLSGADHLELDADPNATPFIREWVVALSENVYQNGGGLFRIWPTIYEFRKRRLIDEQGVTSTLSARTSTMSIIAGLRYVDPCSDLPRRARRPLPAECRPKFISVIAWGARLRECSTPSIGFNLCENCYKSAIPHEPSGSD
ncbi:MAG: GNAT family N-acetyltransferase [Roseiflexus sp.]|nr:GNAT family N-acetyltransferase [Roseiflexus sp.]MBO9365431.1 GNAT family N-acetyltransferase [Roseiflexus sp.]MBO9383317.1 GNAT family N-acetyltransferase [Roseiflexus sp.]MBO9389470.1 GNAT family N-acetyltransferase [Roseiflexus sp.]